MRTVDLPGGYVAIVDDEDYDLVAPYRWCQGRGYAQVSLYQKGSGRKGKRKTLLMHRLVLGAQRGQMIDHVDGNGLNNQRSNLRFCTASQNQANARRRKQFSSRFKGVSAHDGAWVAVLCRKHLGRFATQEEAAEVYAKAAREKFGGFAYVDTVAAA